VDFEDFLGTQKFETIFLCFYFIFKLASREVACRAFTHASAAATPVFTVQASQA
jgi:hypothetical protein